MVKNAKPLNPKMYMTILEEKFEKLVEEKFAELENVGEENA